MIARACLVALLLLPSAVLAGSPTDDLARARLMFEYKKFQEAIPVLSGLLAPTVQLADERDIVQAREMLGLSYFFTGDRARAQAEFTELLYLRPKHELDPFLVPPPAVAFFDSIARDPAMRAKLDQIERERSLREAEARRRAQPTGAQRIYLERTAAQHDRVIAFLPFGLGQRQNGHKGKFLFFAIAQGLCLAVNVVAWAVLEGSQGPRGGFADLELAQGLAITQYAAAGAFGALWLWSAIDANVYFQASIVSPFQRVPEPGGAGVPGLGLSIGVRF